MANWGGMRLRLALCSMWLAATAFGQLNTDALFRETLAQANLSPQEIRFDPQLFDYFFRPRYATPLFEMLLRDPLRLPYYAERLRNGLVGAVGRPVTAGGVGRERDWHLGATHAGERPAAIGAGAGRTRRTRWRMPSSRSTRLSRRRCPPPCASNSNAPSAKCPNSCNARRHSSSTPRWTPDAGATPPCATSHLMSNAHCFNC
jgi:hypothetical protein